MRRLFSLLIVGTFLFALRADLPSQEEGKSEARIEEVTEAQERAVEKAIDWLLKNQNNDGLWGCQKSGAPSAAITGLAILALASTGSSPTKGPHAKPIRKAVERLLRVQSPSGQITLHDATGIGIFYDHSTATLALAEIYGTLNQEDDNLRIRQGLEKAVEYLYRTQSPRDGGWDAQGSGGASDLAITCSVWMALRSAHNAGVEVRNANVFKVEQFVRSCSMPRGGFAQTPSVMGGGGLLFYPTSAGLRILYGMGHRDMEEVVRGTRVLVTRSIGQEHDGRISEWDYCGAFYGVQALLHEGGKYWAEWYPKLRDHLLKIQNPDGSWTIEYCLCCKAYATALATLCLQAPKRMLPLFQL